MSTKLTVHAEVKRVAPLVRAILAHENSEISAEITFDLWLFTCGCLYVPSEDQRNFINGGETGKLVKACLGARLLKNTYNNN